MIVIIYDVFFFCSPAQTLHEALEVVSLIREKDIQGCHCIRECVHFAPYHMHRAQETNGAKI